MYRSQWLASGISAPPPLVKVFAASPPPCLSQPVVYGKLDALSAGGPGAWR